MKKQTSFLICSMATVILTCILNKSFCQHTNPGISKDKREVNLKLMPTDSVSLKLMPVDSINLKLKEDKKTELKKQMKNRQKIETALINDRTMHKKLNLIPINYIN